MKKWRITKLCRITKILLLVMLVGLTHLSANVKSQNQQITLTLKNVTVEQAVNEAEQLLKQNFFFSKNEVNVNRKINVNLSKASLEELIHQVFGASFSYRMEGDIIVVQPNKVADEQKKENMTIQGKVIDKQNLPLPGVTVMIKGSKLGTATDEKGQFKLEFPKQDSVVLVFSFIGMIKKEVHIVNDKPLVVTLEEEMNEMNEVVVTGYANIRKESFTGNSITVNRSDLLKVSQTNIIAALQSFDPSLRIATNNAWGSDPNALPEMYIRGRSGIGVKDLDKDALSKSSLEHNPNLPTFVLDGFEVKMEKVYDLDPSRIESVTILKDAAATAMYGSRAANGVVVITMVTPKPGKVSVSYNFTGGITMPDLNDYNLANAKEKLEIEYLSGVYKADEYQDAGAPLFEYYQRWQRITEGVDTDWLSQPVRNIFNHKHSLYIEGGGEDLRYGLDVSYNNQNGVMKESYRDRTAFGFYVDYRIGRFQVKNNITYTYMKAQESPYGEFSDYTKFLPYDRPYNEKGNLVKNLEFSQLNGRKVNNPLTEIELANYDWNKYDELVDNLSFNWYINDYLSVKGQFSITKSFKDGEKFVDPLSTKSSVLLSSNKQLAGDLFVNEGRGTSWDTQAFIYYQRTIAKNHINFSVGINATSENSKNVYTAYRGFPSGDLHSPNYAKEIVNKPKKTQSESRLFGFIGSLNYTYDDIYLLDASVRVDGSSEFGSNQKYAPFWSGGLGVNLHHYAFLKGNTTLNFLKLKASYGQTGKVNFPPYSASTMYESMLEDWYTTGYGVTLKALGNPDLGWEKTNKLNVGFDMEMFRGMLVLNASYYNDKTVDLITDVTIPFTSGFKSYKDNMGEVKNTGVEIQFRINVINNKDWTLALWGNVAHNKNKILKISESLKNYNDQVNDYYSKAENYDPNTATNDDDLKDPKYSKILTKYEEGGSITAKYGMKSLGIDPLTGQEMFVNRDGSITHKYSAAQQVIIGDEEPDARGAFGFNAAYKNFSLFASFLFEFGGEVYNQTLVDKVENADIEHSNVDKRILSQRWQKPGDVTPLKDIKDRSKTTLPTSRFMQTNRVVSLNALTASYDFNTELVKRIGLSVLRVEVSTSDILRFSSIKQERGTSYPFARTVNFSLRANF